MHVVVVGAGLSGLTLAHYLSHDGASVTVIDRHLGPALGSSFGNTSLLHPGAAEPWNSPMIAAQLWRSLRNRRSPIGVDISALPSLLGWGTNFLRESAQPRYQANTGKNVKLALYSLALMAVLRERLRRPAAGRRGLLQLYRDRASLRAALEARRFFSDHGIQHKLVTAQEAVDLEPALEPVRRRLAGGLFSEMDECENSYAFCTSLEADLRGRGVRIEYGTDCSHLALEGKRIAAVVTTDLRRFEGDVFVLAAGTGTVKLAQSASVRVPIAPVKGYSLTIECADLTLMPTRAVADSNSHIAVVPLHPGQLRVGGIAEFGASDLSINAQKVELLLESLGALYPLIRQGLSSANVKAWAGLRPMTPDGVPILGPTPLDNLFLSAGHGQLGLTLAAGSARCVADLILGRAPSIDTLPYRLER